MNVGTFAVSASLFVRCLRVLPIVLGGERERESVVGGVCTLAGGGMCELWLWHPYARRVRMMERPSNKWKYNGLTVLGRHIYVYLDNLILWCSFARPYFPLFDTITTTSATPAHHRNGTTHCCSVLSARTQSVSAALEWCVRFLMKYRQNNNVFIPFLLSFSLCVKTQWNSNGWN